MSDPLRVSPVTPTSSSPTVGPGKPMVGAGEEAEPKPFSLPPQPGQGEEQKTFSLPSQAEKPSQIESTKPTPMELAGRQQRESTMPWPADEMESHMEKLKSGFADAKSLFDDPTLANKITKDHEAALDRLTSKLDDELKNIAGKTGNEHVKLNRKGDEKVIDYVKSWLDGGQATMGNAIKGFADLKEPDVATLLSLSTSMQRAQERVELFASILSAGTGAIKQLMSTQLG